MMDTSRSTHFTPPPGAMRAILLLAGCLPLMLGCGNSAGSASDDSGSAASELMEDAAFSAALSDGDGEDLGASLASFEPLLAAGEEGVAITLEVDGGFARDCSLSSFEARVLEEYDIDGDGELDSEERSALREEFGPQPVRRHRFARHHRHARLRWIYDDDDSGSLDDAEREELRGDLEERCENRQAYLLATYDADESGSLDEEEWAQAHEDLLARRAALRAALLEEFDLNDDGELDFEERRAAYLARHAAMKARRDAVIEEYDLDDSGDLDSEEKSALREALKQRVRGEHFSELGEEA